MVSPFFIAQAQTDPNRSHAPKPKADCARECAAWRPRSFPDLACAHQAGQSTRLGRMGAILSSENPIHHCTEDRDAEQQQQQQQHRDNSEGAARRFVNRPPSISVRLTHFANVWT